MAKKTTTIVTRTDDFGSAGTAETVRFSLNGRFFEIDLNKRNRETFERRLSAYMDAATEVTPGSAKAETNTSKAELRDWATKNGHTIAAKGRIPLTVVAAYERALFTDEATGELAEISFTTSA